MPTFKYVTIGLRRLGLTIPVLNLNRLIKQEIKSTTNMFVMEDEPVNIWKHLVFQLTLETTQCLKPGIESTI